MLSHKIRIYPSKTQIELLKQSCGVARFTYNWGLAKWEELYKQNKKPTFYKIKLLFNKEKRTNPELKWLYNVTKCSPEYALINLGNAFVRFFKKQGKYPKFKKKRFGIGSFSISNDKFSIDSNYCKLSKVGKVKMAESLRFDGKIMKGTVSCFAGRWFLSVTTKIEHDKNTNGRAAGIDLGLKNQIITSEEEYFNVPDLNKEIKRIKKEQKNLSRKQKGSKNRLKQIIKVQKAWYKYNNKKTDWIEKTTTYLANKYQYIGLENLNIKGLMKNGKLSGKFQLVSLHRLIERLKTKATVIQIDRFFPSSKLCSVCGQLKKDLKLSDRVYKCKCGNVIDRDLNAAINILREAFPEVTPVNKEALALSFI